MLQAFNITRTSGQNTLLDSASIAVNAGERVALTGASGSGKTVLLRALALLDPIDSGTVQWNGADIEDAEVPRFRSRVMYLHQQPASREGTVESVLEEPFQLQVHKQKPFSREQIVQWLEQLDKPESFLNQSHIDLSGGESQIVALLRAMQLNPNVLLLDEPTSALDADTSLKVESWLVDWVQATDDRAFLWITHDVQQAERISNRAIRIANGRLEMI
ncbi:ATP-binding cassette domain-containing protein [Mariniblastus sp.]|nr:ATP-binding cassette domain-containing protein [Mariniblastus sp.]